MCLNHLIGHLQKQKTLEAMEAFIQHLSGPYGFRLQGLTLIYELT